MCSAGSLLRLKAKLALRMERPIALFYKDLTHLLIKYKGLAKAFSIQNEAQFQKGTGHSRRDVDEAILTLLNCKSPQPGSMSLYTVVMQACTIGMRSFIKFIYRFPHSDYTA
jgi:hypothetical protein